MLPWVPASLLDKPPLGLSSWKSIALMVPSVPADTKYLLYLSHTLEGSVGRGTGYMCLGGIDVAPFGTVFSGRRTGVLLPD